MYLTRLLTNSELTNSECNPEYLNCQYSLEQDMQDNCSTKTKGYVYSIVQKHHIQKLKITLKCQETIIVQFIVQKK